MKRSRRFVFVSFCMLAQGIRAQGIVDKFSSIVHPIIDFLQENEINIVQMPCPELEFDGLIRPPKIKEDYEKFREKYREIAKKVIKFAKNLIENGYTVLAFLGIEKSPSCAVTILSNNGEKVPGTGIFMEEIRKELIENDLEIPIVGVDLKDPQKAINELRKILKRLSTTK